VVGNQLRSYKTIERKPFDIWIWRGVRTKAYSSGCCLGFSLTHVLSEFNVEFLQIFSAIEVLLILEF
jgi:hypothetical protein